LKIAVFGDNDTAVGFKLAGIHDVFKADGNEREIWNKICDRDDIGILFITEKIAEALGKYLKDYRVSHDTPIIVEIPDKKGRLKDHVDFISHLIKKAVGVEVEKG
jgi:V/A-type H+-transporting ATPase subunit F